MKHIDFEFHGRQLSLSLTANALFKIYDEFGYTTEIIKTLKLMERSEEGWRNTCWLFCLLACEGEKQRRLMGEDHRPMLGMEELRLSALPADVIPVRNAAIAALRQGFSVTVESEQEEQDMVLADLGEIEKKKKARAAIARLSSLFVR